MPSPKPYCALKAVAALPKPSRLAAFSICMFLFQWLAPANAPEILPRLISVPFMPSCMLNPSFPRFISNRPVPFTRTRLKLALPVMPYPIAVDAMLPAKPFNCSICPICSELKPSTFPRFTMPKPPLTALPPIALIVPDQVVMLSIWLINCLSSKKSLVPILEKSIAWIRRIVFCRKRCFPSFYCVKTRALSYERCRGKSSPRSQVLAALLATCRCGLVCSPFVTILLTTLHEQGVSP